MRRKSDRARQYCPRRRRPATTNAVSVLCILAYSSKIYIPHLSTHNVCAFQSAPPPLQKLTHNRKLFANRRPDGAVPTHQPRSSYLDRRQDINYIVGMQKSPPPLTAMQMASPIDQEDDTSSSNREKLNGNGSANSLPKNGSSNKHDDKEIHQSKKKQLPPILQKMADKVGKIDESRIISTPEYLNGEEPRLYINLQYTTKTTGNETIITVAERIESSNTNYFISSSALLCGTALGTGLINLPTAISQAGYLPTIVATLVAWGYMTISALLTSELLINRYGETGRVRNVGLLELYNSYLGENVGGKLAGVGFLVVSYIVLGVYLSEGGNQLMNLLDISGTFTANDASMMREQLQITSITGDFNIFNYDSFIARSIFVFVMGIFLSTADIFNTVQKSMTHLLFPCTILAFVAAICIGLPTADLSALMASENQHPEVVLNSFPLLFMSWTYHGVVPRVVYDLEGDKNKITKAIVLGSTTALIIYLTWNAMILGNVLGGVDFIDGASAMSTTAGDLIETIQESSTVVLGDMISVNGDPSAAAGTSSASQSLDMTNFAPLLQTSIAIVSELAVITSLIGVVLGFVNEFNDAIGWENGNTSSNTPAYGPREDNKKWKVALLTLLPPAIVSICLGYYSDEFNINNYQIIDYTGIFGSSILFLILPALMAWQNRYSEDNPRPLTVRPMVPLGKISLSSLYKAAGTLIIEQGLEKIGVFEFVKERLHL